MLSRQVWEEGRGISPKIVLLLAMFLAGPATVLWRRANITVLDSLHDQGFDRYYGLRDGACNHFNPGKQRDGEGLPAQKRREKRPWCFDEKIVKPFTPKDKKFYTTDAFTGYAMDFLDDYKDESKPFFSLPRIHRSA